MPFGEGGPRGAPGNIGADFRALYATERERIADLLSINAELLKALKATLPALILLGDFIGNEFSGKVGIEAFDRCKIVLDARAAIAKAEGKES